MRPDVPRRARNPEDLRRRPRQRRGPELEDDLEGVSRKELSAVRGEPSADDGSSRGGWPLKSGAAHHESRNRSFPPASASSWQPIGNYLDDPRVTEIMVNGPDEIYVEIGGRLFETEDRFASEDVLQSAVHNIAQYVGREIDPERPILDARLPDGSTSTPSFRRAARRGTYLTIRKFRRDVHTLDDFVTQGSLSPIAREFLAIAVRLRKNVLIAGGTGTGKTTFLNALSAAVPAERADRRHRGQLELRLNQPHSLYLESQQADSEGRKESLSGSSLPPRAGCVRTGSSSAKCGGESSSTWSSR